MHLPAWFQAILLGLVEGITEFLPVSSTGHLILAAEWLNFQDPSKVFEIAIQTGAVLAVCLAYRQRLTRVVCQLPRERQAQHFVLNILIAFLPAALLGVALHGFIKSQLFNSHVVAVSLIVGGIAILIIERMNHRPRFHQLEDFPPRLALLIGLVQCLALIPGVSRSGATIMGALLAGADRKAAAEFSFFLAIPTLAGAAVYDLFINRHLLTADALWLLAIGFVTSFISAYIVVEWLIRFVSRHGFTPFAWYRIALGGAILAVGYF